VTARHAIALAAPVGRSLPRLHLAGAAGAALLLVALTASEPPGATALLGLQLAGMTLALSLGLVLEDPAAPTLAGSPVGLLARRLLTLALCLPFLAATWAALLMLAGLDGTWALALTIQVSALAALVLALAAGLGPRASMAGPAVVLLFATARLLVPQWTLTAGSHDAHWAAAEVMWAALAAAGALALAWLSRDPATRPLLTGRRSPLAPWLRARSRGGGGRDRPRPG
jgi:hypothetical protein